MPSCLHARVRVRTTACVCVHVHAFVWVCVPAYMHYNRSNHGELWEEVVVGVSFLAKKTDFISMTTLH